MKSQVNSLMFRDVIKNDIDEIYDLLNGLTEQEKRFFHPHPFDKKTITKICTSKKDHYFAMVLDNKIIGYSMLRLFGYEIPSLGCCIRNGYKLRGYGTILTRWTLKKAKELGYNKVILKVYKENNIAFHVYKKTGFKIVGENKDTNEIKMAISL